MKQPKEYLLVHEETIHRRWTRLGLPKYASKVTASTPFYLQPCFALLTEDTQAFELIMETTTKLNLHQFALSLSLVSTTFSEFANRAREGGKQLVEMREKTKAKLAFFAAELHLLRDHNNSTMAPNTHTHKTTLCLSWAHSTLPP